MAPNSMKSTIGNFFKGEQEILLSGKGKFSAKNAQLVGFSAAVGMKCEFCIIAYTANAKRAGAT